MKQIIAFNMVSVCFILLAAYIIHLDKDGWGWCIVAALLVAAVPKENNNQQTPQ